MLVEQLQRLLGGARRDGRDAIRPQKGRQLPRQLGIAADQQNLRCRLAHDKRSVSFLGFRQSPDIKHNYAFANAIFANENFRRGKKHCWRANSPVKFRHAANGA